MTANPRRDALAVVALGIFALTLTIAYSAISVTPVGARWAGIVPVFHQAATALVHGTAETTFLSLYPPLSLLPVTLPGLLAPDLATYAFLLGLEMSLVAAVGLLIVMRLEQWPEFQERRGATVACAVFLLLASTLVGETFDIVPSVLALAAMAATIRQRPFAAGGLLGLAAAMKVYPAVLLPAILLWYWFRDERKKAGAVLFGFGVASAVGLGLYLFFSPASPIDLWTFHAGRALQVESLPASLIGLGSALGMVPRPEVVFSSGSFNLTGPAADAGLAVLGLAGPLAIAAALAATAFRVRLDSSGDARSADALVLGFAGLLLATMLTSKFLSPQYLIWLLPVVPFLATTQRVFGVLAMVLTAAIFPFMYDGIISLQLIPMALLVVRNGLLLGLFALVLFNLTDWIGHNMQRSAMASRVGIGG